LEEAGLHRGQTVADISLMPTVTTLENDGGRLVLHGRFPYLRYPRHYTQEDHAAAREAMAQLGIEDLASAPMETLSGGTRQKVYIAMALAQQTPVILMDEPTAYLDMGQQIRFAQTARELARRGKTVVLVLHDIPLALRLSDHLAVLQEGSLLDSGTPAQILESGVLSRLYGVELCPVAGEDPVQYYYRIP
jgi:iron complex transport system ATP-binding protein